MEGACGSLWYRKNTTINKHTGITYFKIMLHFLVGNIFFCKISYQTSMKSLKVCRNSSSFHGRDVHGCITYASVQNKSHSPPPGSSSLAFASLWGSSGSSLLRWKVAPIQQQRAAKPIFWQQRFLCWGFSVSGQIISKNFVTEDQS